MASRSHHTSMTWSYGCSGQERQSFKRDLSIEEFADVIRQPKDVVLTNFFMMRQILHKRQQYLSQKISKPCFLPIIWQSNTSRAGQILQCYISNSQKVICGLSATAYQGDKLAISSQLVCQTGRGFNHELANP